MFAPHRPFAVESAQDREFQRQHEEIFSMLGIVREHHDCSGQGRLLRAYEDFLACTRAHFAAEELLLARCEPMRMTAHKAAHDAILRRAVDLGRRLGRLEVPQLLLQLQTVDCWLTDHCIDEGANLI